MTALDDIKDTNGFGSDGRQADAAHIGPERGPPCRSSASDGRADVDRYLAGAAVDKVTDLDVDPFRLKTVRQDGTSRPAPPADQTFWVARGAARTRRWTGRSVTAAIALVMMNADASTGVGLNGRFGLTIPHLFAFGIGILIAGIVAVLIGITLLVVGVRMRPSCRPRVCSFNDRLMRKCRTLR